MRGFTYASGTASSVSISADTGTEIRQKSSARSTRPSATISAAVGMAFDDVGERADLVGLDAPAELLELDDTVVRGARRALVAAAVLEDDEAVAVGHVLELAARGDGGRVLLVLDRVQEHVLHGAVQRIDALDEDDEVRRGKTRGTGRG